MATFAMIHGAGSDAWYWHLVEPELRRYGHDVVAPNLPCEDDSAGLDEYTDVVVDAIGDRRGDMFSSRSHSRASRHLWLHIGCRSA